MPRHPTFVVEGDDGDVSTTQEHDDDRLVRPRPAAAHSVVKTLWPGQPGTLELRRRYGETLLCVRYRRDTTGLRRMTTVELIVASGPVRGRRSDQREFVVLIGHHESELRARARARGARWQEGKLWRIRGKAVKALNLYDRVRG